jgi:hypothetical protein
MNTNTKPVMGRYVGYVAAIAALAGAVSGCAPNSDTAWEYMRTHGYTVEGMPLSAPVIQNNFTNCDISVVVDDVERGTQQAIGRGNCTRINVLQSMLEAEMNDGDNEQIKMKLFYEGAAEIVDLTVGHETYDFSRDVSIFDDIPYNSVPNIPSSSNP